jgi:hypothetical protein
VYWTAFLAMIATITYASGRLAVQAPAPVVAPWAVRPPSPVAAIAGAGRHSAAPIAEKQA